ncbi:MAG: SOS response-associated peptidase [Bacteroidia bacterium]
MCGRYAFTQVPQAAVAVSPDAALLPRYNVAPTNLCPVFPQDDPTRVHLFRWGLIPHWAKDEKIGYQLINARAETVFDKPAFREGVRRSRCLVWADGFYEWKKEGKSKQPYRIGLRSGEPFTFAGLSARWRHPAGHWVDSFTIITTTPNDLMAGIHDRMPVILRDEAARLWLDPGASAGVLAELLVPFPSDALEAYPVSSAVGNVRNDYPELAQRLD